ncbi:protein TolR [Psychrobacter sp. HD31]|uniref:protein TolR n=1 Tax=Psychrobacter sp. HD31 TaxID=3112003 RepID=UPI003DA22232
MKPSAYSRRPKQLNANMNVVPYIDVMLVLLVIFMVATPMMKTGVDVDLPQEQTQSLDTSTQMPVIVSLSKNGELFINYDTKNLAVTNDQLIGTLQQIQNSEQTKGNGIQVMVNADQTNQYGDIMELMANIQQAGVQKVGLLTGNTPQPNKP